MDNIIARALITPDGTILQTFSDHDYKDHLDKNGELYMIDGGPSKYGRSSVNKIEGEHIIITTDSPFEEIRKWFHWGSYGNSTPVNGIYNQHLGLLEDSSTEEVKQKENAFRMKHEIEDSLLDKPLTSKNKAKI